VMLVTGRGYEDAGGMEESGKDWKGPLRGRDEVKRGRRRCVWWRRKVSGGVGMTDAQA
jgi:hypothetical protein